ncbi:metallophosphoesterase [Synechococcus sp. CS-1325]|uniref:metallophosphoesterase family protein n=1 Tax=Synechococcus sp. CS-1325 TaxID=2847979 RepID=UPI000DAF5CF2|nr:metallophosphoesterase [Synechococcus sp. CS-1325]MCT0199883.1 metallophosphoesterase [Synechococcus sp. CS-1325]PZU96864.1 MAG: metallophosphoesterase [Cyanobium sp.]
MQPPLSRRRFLGLTAGAIGTGAIGTGVLGTGALGRAAFGSGSGFTLPPRADLRLVLISDLNASYGSTSYIPEVGRAVALIPSLQADLVLCAGDMVAGQKTSLSNAQLTAMWESFGRLILAPLRRAGLPFAPAMGNHDASASRSGGLYTFERERQEAARFWRRRQSSLGLDFLDASGFPFFYSVLQDGLFLLVWDASSALVPAEQVRWAERSLASPAARSARRRLVLGHLPLQAVARGRDDGGNVLNGADALRQLMERHDVSAYISGHQHAYFPARLGRLDLFQLGAAGSGPRALLQGGAAPFQTLTVLDLAWSSGRTVDTTINLRTMRPVERSRLPERLINRQGRVLQRRPG